MSRQAHDDIGQEFRGKGTVRKAAMESKAWMRTLIVVWGAALAGLGLATPTLAANILVWQFEDSQPGVQEARASAVDSHGNLIITGYSDDGGDDDFYTVKIASDGQTVLWSAREVHPGSDWATAVAVDEHDDVIITGFRFNGVNDDIAVIKYDGATGAQKWAPFLYNGPANGNDMPRALAIDALDNIYVAGYSQFGGVTGEDAVLLKLSPAGPTGDGTPLWQYHFDGAAGGEDRFDSVSARGAEVVVTGHSKVSHAASRLDFDYLTIKFDAAGNVLWQQLYDNGSGDDLATHCGIDSAGDVVVTGEALTVDRHDMVTIKYAASDGARLWLTPYSAGSPNLAKGLVVDADGEVYLTGSTFTNTGKEDFYTARLSGANGVEVWGQVFDSGTNNTDVPQALGVDSTGGLYVTGYTHKFDTQDYDFQTLKYNKANGNQIWQQAQDGPPAGGNQQPVGLAVALGVAADGNVYVGGWSQVADDVDYFAVKYSADLVNAPTGLNLTVVSANRIDLTWADNSADPRNEDNFCVERCQGFACADFVELTCAIPQNQTTYSDTTVTRDAWYSYRVYGKNNALGLSLPTAPASALSTVINYPAPTWLYTHDGEGLDDMANAIVMGKDNNPVATGVSAKVASQYDYYTVKLNRADAATPLWIDDYDGPDGQGDMGICLTTDSADNVVVSGFASLDDGQGGNTNDIFTIKYLATGPDLYSGYPLWTAQYNGPANGDDRAIAVAAASDGSDYTVVTGHGRNINLNEDIYLVKYRPNYDVAGQQVWAITPFDRGFDDRPVATAFTPAGDVVVVGSSERAAGDSDIFISLYQGSDGAVMSGWPYIHDFGHGIDGVDAVVVGPDNSIYVAGYTMNVTGNLDIYVNKFNASGVAQWGTGKIVDGAGHGYDRAHAIAIDPNDGEIIVAATTTSASGSLDFLLLRYSTSGTLRWQKTLDLISHDEDLKGMAVSPSGEVCLVGETDNDFDGDVIAVKYDHLGNLIGSTKYNSGFEDFATAITVNRLGEFFVSGYSASGPLASDDFDFVVWKFNGQELQAPSPLTSTTHNTTVDLTWTENDPNVTSYKLYRANGVCTEGGTTFTSANLITTLPQGTTSYTNGGLNIGSTYCYGVQAFRQATSEVSRVIERQVTTTTPVPPSAVVATLRNTSEVEVCWHDNSASEDGFAIQRCTGANCDFSQVTTLFAPAELDPAAAATCLVDTTACDSGAGKAFRYRVQAYKVNAWSSGFAGATDTVVVPPLLAPSGLMASRVTDTAVDLLWTDNTVDETDFSIERCAGAGCSNFAEIATISAVSGNALLLEMDEAAWTAAAGAVGDSSGHDRHATAFGGPTTVANGHQGRAASFDGANDYLTSPLVIDQSVSSAGVTMMAWVKPSSTSGLRYLFSSEDGTVAVPKNSWGLLQNGASWQVATGEAIRPTNVAVSAGVWQHLAVVFAPGTGVKFYLNGVETYISYIGTHDSSAPLTIGRQGVLNQSFFAGLVDEAAVYSRALSAAEVQKLYSRGVFPEVSGQKWFTDSTVAVNADYQYQIKARKLTGCGTDISPLSNTIALNTIPLPPQALTASLVKPGVVSLNWGVQTSTQTGFQIERCNGASCTDFVTIATVSGAAARKYTDNTACFGTDGVNRYQIRALGPWGYTAPSAVAVVASSPGVLPGGLTVSQTSEASVKLSWTFASNVDGFTVERCSGDQATCAQTNAFSEVAGSPFTGQDPALQAVWHLEETAWSGAAGEVIDSSGHGHHASGMNGISLDSPGVNSFGAASFDGVDDYLSTDLQIDQSATSPGLTFMAWVYQTDQSGRYQEIFTTDNGGYDWGVRIYSNNFYLANGTTLYYSGSVGTINTWHHIAAVFNPDSGYQFYRDGTLLTSSANLDLDPSSGPLLIGRHPSEGNYFAGKMDEIVVLNRPLSAAEVVAAYNHNTPAVVVDSSVSPGMTYTYRIRPQVNNLCGDWAQNAATAEITASTPADPLPPTALAVSQQGSTELDLSWHSNTTSETAFVVERCAGSGCDFSTVDTFQTGPGVTAFKDTSVCQGQLYRYRVMAVKGAAAPWQWQTAYTTPVEQTTAATSPVTLTLSVVNEAEIGVSWNDVNPDEEAYVLSRCLIDPGLVACDQPEQFAEIASFPGSVPGLLLAYRMDEAAWTGAAYEVVDSSGNGHNGTAYGGVTTTADGHFGRAGVFNGANNYVYSSQTLNQSRSSSGITMEAWVYPTMTDNSPRSVLSTDNNGADWGVVVQNGKWYVMTGRSQYDTGLAVDLNSWQHITVVFTPLVGIQFYKGNELITINEIDYSLSPGVLNIGRSASSTNIAYFFQGRIDEVLVYNRPLNASEVASHATGQVLSAYDYADQGLQHSSTYRYKVTAHKTAACPWSQEAMATDSTPAPPPPTGLLETNDSTSATLSWQDNNGSETGYVVSRCEGATGDCPTPVVVSLPANSTSYQDDSLCSQQPYTYRVWAIGAWGQTAFVEQAINTLAPSDAPTNLLVNQTSEVKLDLSWTNDPSVHDETGLKLSRCLGGTCDEILLPPATSSYSDDELAPNSEYCYQVSVYKTASCAWQSPATASVCATTTPAAGSLTATPANTTTVDLAWADGTQTETSSVVERCAGDLASCCNGDPATCAGPFGTVAVVGTNQQTYVDAEVCAGTDYTYRVNSKGEGLTQANGGCWTKRAPLTFTSFPALAGVEVVIPYQPEMKADFSDLRFYDTTAHRELAYWLKSKIDSTSATVWLMTGANPAISLYYGNPLATSASASAALFTEVYDDFQGSTINPDKWLELDAYNNKISQNNGLQFVYRDQTQNAAVISTKTFERAAGNELTIDFTVGADVQGFLYESFFMGWEKDQVLSPTVSGNAAHLLNFASNGNHYLQYVYEDTASTYFTKILYNDLTRYQVKIVLNAGSGAKYYLRGGIYPAWQLIAETTTVRANDDLLRIGFHQDSHNITIHQVTVQHASAQHGAAVNFAGAEGDGLSCLSFSYTWLGSSTPAAAAVLPQALAPTNLTAQALEGAVQLAWAAGTGDETEFQIERDCGAGFVGIGTSPGQTTSYRDTTMPASTTCVYQVKGHKAAACPWTSSPSPAAPILAPPAGPVVVATAVGPFQVKLTWNDASDEEGYEVEAQVFNGAWMPLATLPADRLSYTDSHGVNPTTSYTYRVRARRAGGNSAWGVSSATTPVYTPGAATCPLEP